MSVWNVPIGSQADPSSFLEDILATRIDVPEALRSSARDNQNSLRRLLTGEAQRNPSFPRALAQSDRDFIGGSFGRHTEIRPQQDVDVDIDIYIPLDGAGLVYNGSGRQSCALLSDDATSRNPVFRSKWMPVEHLSSGAFLEAFANVLGQHYPNAKRIRKVEEAVRVQTTLEIKNTTENLGYDDLGYDVVPCFVLGNPDPRQLRVYLIPDGNNGWIRTNPRFDVALTDALSAKTNENFRKAVKIVKFWNSSIFGNKLSSYYIELALQKAVLQRVSVGQSLQPLSFATAFAFWALNQAVQAGNLKSWVSVAPPVTPGSLSPSDLDLLTSLSSVAWQAWEQERDWQWQEATSSWELIFGAAEAQLISETQPARGTQQADV